MSHDDIKAALVRDHQRGGRFPADPELQHKAPTWLAELLAEVDALTARAEAAERAIQRVRDLAKYLSGLAGGDRHYADQILRALDGGAS